MVQVVRTCDTRSAAEAAFGVPLVHIHDVERHVHGNSIVVKVWGQMKIAAKERIYARELKMNTLQILMLTVDDIQYPLVPVKWIYHKGEYDNYASIDILGPRNAYQFPAGADARQDIAAIEELPYDGSIWLNFMALGE